MARVVVLGEQVRVGGFALAGADVVVADTPQGIRSAVEGLDDEVAVLVLTPSAAAMCSLLDGSGRERLVAVMPP